jgi:hypothetical protein
VEWCSQRLIVSASARCDPRKPDLLTTGTNAGARPAARSPERRLSGASGNQGARARHFSILSWGVRLRAQAQSICSSQLVLTLGSLAQRVRIIGREPEYAHRAPDARTELGTAPTLRCPRAKRRRLSCPKDRLRLFSYRKQACSAFPECAVQKCEVTSRESC